MDCPICIQRMDDISTLACGHRFHTECVNTWKSTGRHTCPMCRSEMKEGEDSVRQDQIAMAVRWRDAEILRLTQKARDLELENIRSLIQIGNMQSKLRNHEKENMKDTMIAVIGMMLIAVSLVFKLQ